MWIVVTNFLTQFIDFFPPLIAIVLIFNLIADLLWGGR